MLALILNAWKEGLRSPALNKNIGVKLFFGFMTLYFSAIFLGLGIVAKPLAEELRPEQSALLTFSGWMFYYLLADLFARYLMQELPTLKLRPYLHLPIPRSQLAHFLLIRMGLSPFNLMPLLTLVPFTIIGVAPEVGGLAAGFWCLGIFALSQGNNYWAALLKRANDKKFIVVLVALFAVGAIGALDYYGVLPLSTYVGQVLALMAQQPVLVLVPLALLALAYWVNFRWTLTQMYPDTAHIGTQTEGLTSVNLPFLSRLGAVGDYILLELKLLLRHKRTRTVLIVNVFFMFYGLIFYTNDLYKDSIMWLLFVAILLTGMSTFNYGQFFFSWESSYFELILAKNVNLRKYLAAKWVLLAVFNTLCFVVSLLYALLDVKYAWLHLAAWLYNTGVNIPVIIFLATYNKKYIDLSANNPFNWQGTGASQFLMGIPSLLGPMLIMLPFWAFQSTGTGLWVLGGLGVLGLVLSPWLLGQLAGQLREKRYAMLAGFRAQ